MSTEINPRKPFETHRFHRGQRTTTSYTWDGWSCTDGKWSIVVIFLRGECYVNIATLAGHCGLTADQIKAILGERVESYGADIVSIAGIEAIASYEGVNIEYICWLTEMLRAPEILPGPSLFILFAWIGPGSPTWTKNLSESPPASQFVYVFRDRKGKRYKIGISGNPHRRLNGVKGASGVADLTMVAHMPGSILHERALHLKFAEHRTHGEWFRDCQPIRDWIAAGCALPELPPQTSDDDVAPPPMGRDVLDPNYPAHCKTYQDALAKAAAQQSRRAEAMKHDRHLRRRPTAQQLPLGTVALVK